MLTMEAVGQFLSAKRAKGLSPKTLAPYRYRLTLFARLHAALPMDPATIEAFLSQIGPSPENRETYYRLLRNLYRWLRRRKLIGENPIEDIEAPRLPRKVARALTLEQVHQLLNHPDHSEQVRAFLSLLADTGIRLSEALSVDAPEAVGEQTILVRGKTGDREVPISSEVREAVLQALPWPWSDWQAAGGAVRRAFNRAGFTGKRASAQTLRHTFVRLWGGDETLLTGILGWTSGRMLRVYRPYDVQRALTQHQIYSPIALSRRRTERQSSFW